ncbi:hypothetical protein BGZ73_008982 [Actinomortierella ambigua]|nr:hypothetical protein BGZ73_008982 [Actinomortierella ambigua]
MAVQASFESLRPLQVPITIVTAASENHLCALEAFLYDFDRIMTSSFQEDPDQKELRITRRRVQNQWYLKNSRDLARLTSKKKIPHRLAKEEERMEKELAKAAGGASIEGIEGAQEGTDGVVDEPVPDIEESFLFNKRRDDHDPSEATTKQGTSALPSSDLFGLPSQTELRPRLVVYNLGMGSHKRKRQRFKALVEAGYMDEVYDFEFWRYPAFWSLGNEDGVSPTRGEYGWKAGIVEEVAMRILESPAVTMATAAARSGQAPEKKGRYKLHRRQGDDDDLVLNPLTDGNADIHTGKNDTATTTTSSLEDEALNELEADEQKLVSLGDSTLSLPPPSPHDSPSLQEGKQASKNTGFAAPHSIEANPSDFVEDTVETTLLPSESDSSSSSSSPPPPPPPPPPASPSDPPSPHIPQIVLWADSGDRFSPEFFRWLPSHVRRYGIWTPQSGDTMHRWTHPGLPEYYHTSLSDFAEDETNCNGAVMAFDIQNSTVRDGILREWIRCARRKECIAPEGSSRENHRQDQAALTYLVKTMGYGDQQCRQFPREFGVLTNMDHTCKDDVARNPHRVVS